MNSTESTHPFEDIRKLISEMPGPDLESAEQVRTRDSQLTKPAGSLGSMEKIAEWMASWQGKSTPTVDKPLVAIFAGNHGVASKGVSAFPAEVTQQMVANFTGGGAAINQICKTFNLGLKVFELALELPTPDITEEDAFDEADCAATIAFGMEAIKDTDLLIIGEMGIGNTTVAAAIYHALFGGSASDWTGYGTGVDETGLKNKQLAVENAVSRISSSCADPLEVLRRIGGREIAAMAGAILASRMQRVPVVVDGFVATSAAAVLHATDNKALDHCIFGHKSAEGAHAKALEAMKKEPILNLGMRLGEGSGAALAAGIIQASVNTHNGMSTFSDAGVANKQ